MAVFEQSRTYALSPLLRTGLVGELHDCHGRTLGGRKVQMSWDGTVRDLEGGRYLKLGENGEVVFSNGRTRVQIVEQGKHLILRIDGKNVSSNKDGSMRLVDHCRAWEKYQLRDVYALGWPERAIDARVAALAVLLEINSVFRLRCCHGGLLSVGCRCDAADNSERAVQFRVGKRTDVDRFQLVIVSPSDADFLTGSTLTAELRLGAGEVAKLAIRATDVKYPLGRYLRADPSGLVTERVDIAEEWENYVVEVTQQSVSIGLRELAAKNATKLARETPKTASSGKKNGKETAQSGFNFSSALRGASDAPSDAGSKKSGSAPKPKTEGKQAKPLKQKPLAADNPKTQSSQPALQTKDKSKKLQPREENAPPVAQSRRSKKKQRSKKKPSPSAPVQPASTPTNAPAEKKKPTAEEKKAMDEKIVDNGDEADFVPLRPKDPCFACGRDLEGTITTAMGRKFHSACFVCFSCRRPLVGGTFRENAGKAYCNTCYKEKIAPRCAACGEGILGTVTTALEKSWHPHCFRCVRCSSPITADKFYILPHRPREPFCGSCHGANSRTNGPQFNVARVRTPFT